MKLILFSSWDYNAKICSALPWHPIQQARDHVFRPMMMERRADGSLPCWPIVPDNDGKTNDGQRERQRESPMGNAAKRKAQSHTAALYCPASWFLPFPPAFSITSFLSRSCRLIRKFRGKERKVGVGRVAGGGLALLHHSKRSLPRRNSALRHHKTSEYELLTTREVPKRVTRNN